MTGLRTAKDDYLASRRRLGFRLDGYDCLLASFVTFMETHAATVVTVDLALAWATLPTGASPWWLGQRLNVVRGFARYLNAFEPATQVPPTDLIPRRPPRVTPYLFSFEEVGRIMDAAHQLRPALRGETYTTLIGLLAVTGMRVGEAIGLDRNDVNLEHGRVLIREGKFGKDREIPIHTTTVAALRAYDDLRGALTPHASTNAFFVSTVGTRLHYCNVAAVWRSLVNQVGIGDAAHARRPGTHDMRHSFAVRTLLNGYIDGCHGEARLPILAAYLGHTNPAATYWYLTASPELLAAAATRLEASMGALP